MKSSKHSLSYLSCGVPSLLSNSGTGVALSLNYCITVSVSAIIMK